MMMISNSVLYAHLLVQKSTALQYRKWNRSLNETLGLSEEKKIVWNKMVQTRYSFILYMSFIEHKWHKLSGQDVCFSKCGDKSDILAPYYHWLPSCYLLEYSKSSCVKSHHKRDTILFSVSLVSVLCSSHPSLGQDSILRHK